jgi:ABC-type transport system involved in cytochrome bd biosynthesis fused ATPase/permease subunit
MATILANIPPSQAQSFEPNKRKSLTQNYKKVVKNVAQSTQKRVASMGMSLLARILFRQRNFNFLDIPTANLNITQQEMINDLNERMP